jgi:hypothetical protein|tara:strand:+ start:2083 stop:2970 length:888 start_codon:yes stop_codon:yes gene_type:complete
MEKWQKYVHRIREDANFKKRIRSYIKDRDKMLDAGGQENSEPFTKKMPKHVTFDKQLEEEVERESFEMQTHLHPKFWKDDELNARISAKLRKIVHDFIEGLDVDINPRDIRLTGSIANYNWSKYSDIDLHIVVKFSDLDEDKKIVKSFFDFARMRWNDSHDIKIYGHEVEIYVENEGESHESSGIYSIVKDRWVVMPTEKDAEIDMPLARKKSDSITTQINLINHMLNAKKYKASVKTVARLKEKIRHMRRAGLNSPQKEFSPENIAFKILRREGMLEKLNNLKYSAYDKMMSIS